MVTLTVRRSVRCVFALLSLFIFGLCVSPALAAVQYSSALGTWSNGGTGWSAVPGGPYTANWSSYDDAIFEGTPSIVTASGTVDFNSITFAANGYTVTGGTFGMGSPGGGTTITVNPGLSATVSPGSVSHAGGLTHWNKAGSGTLTMSGTNDTATTAVNVNAGTLTLVGASNAQSYAIASGAVLNFNDTSGTDHSGTSFSGGGTLRKTGAGNTVWGGSATTFAMSAGSTIDVQAGTVTGGSSANENWTANQANLHVAAGALFNGVEANVRVGALSGDGTIRSGYSGAGYSTFTFGVGDASGSFNGTLSHNDGSFYGHYTKEGTGTQTFTGTVNTIADGAGTGMTISAGTVEIGGAGTFSGGSWPNAMINNGTFRYNSTANNTMAGVISGSGALVKANSGTLNISANPSYTGDTTANGGKLVFNSAANWSNSSNWIINGGTLELAGGIGRIVNMGATPKTISFGANGGTFDTGGVNFHPSTTSGASFIISTTAGAPQSVFKAAASSGILGLNADDDTTTFNVALGSDANTDLLMSAPIWNGGAIIKAGAGRMTMTGANSHTGSISVQQGTLTMQNTSSSSAYSISSGAKLVMDVASGTRDMTGNATISGAGTFQKTGAGTLLWGATGATFAMSAGSTIDVQGGAFLGGSSANENWAANQSNLNVAGGALFNGVEANVRVGALSGDGTIRSGFTCCGYSTFTFGVGDASGSFNGTLSHFDGTSYGHYTKEGAGTQIFTGTVNTIANGGATGLTIAAGTVEIGGAGTFAGGSWPNAMTNNGTFHYNSTVSNVMSGQISGSGALIKSNSGNLTVTGFATYTGATTVNAGALELTGGSESGGFRYFDSAPTVNNGATLNVNANGFFISMTKNITLSGGTLAGSGAFNANYGQIFLENGVQVLHTGNSQSLISAEVHMRGTHEFNVPNGAAPIDLLVTGRLSHEHFASWAGITKTGSGTLSLANSSNGIGGVELNGGTVVFAAGALGNNAAPAVKVAVYGPYYLADFTGNSTLQWDTGNTQDISVNGNMRIGAGITATLHTNGNDVTLGTGIVGGGAGAALTKIGAGTLTLGGNNTYTGLTTVTAGTLRLNGTAGGNSVLIGDGSTATNDVLINGGTLLHGADEQIANNASINMTSGAWNLNGRTETIYAFTNSGGTFTTGVGGDLIGLGATINWAGGANTINADGTTTDSHYVITGGTNTVQGAAGPPAGVAGGQLIVAAPGGVGLVFGSTASPTITVNSDGTSAGGIVLNNNVTVDGTLTSGTAQILNGGNAANPGYVDLGATTRTFDINNGSAAVDMLVSARIQNGSLTKTGAGTLRLTGDNTYTGSTTVSTGTLELAAPGTLQNGSIAVNAGTFLQSGGTNNVTGGTGVGDLNIASGAAYALNGGALDFHDTNGATGHHTDDGTAISEINVAAGGAFNFNGGILRDVTTIETNGGIFTQNGGAFYVGQNELAGGYARVTTINGGFELLGGTLHLDVFGADPSPEECCDGVPTLNDQLSVNGTALLDSTISLDFEGFAPEFGDVFTLVCSTNPIELADGFHIDGGFFRLVPTGNNQFPFALQAIVPEPASVAVWTLVALSCGVYSYRRQRRPHRKLVTARS